MQDQLDLHGLRTRRGARRCWLQFLARAVARGLRCVRIVHGKGWRSKNREPVLKRKVRAGWRSATRCWPTAGAAGGGRQRRGGGAAEGATHEARGTRRRGRS